MHMSGPSVGALSSKEWQGLSEGAACSVKARSRRRRSARPGVALVCLLQPARASSGPGERDQEVGQAAQHRGAKAGGDPVHMQHADVAGRQPVLLPRCGVRPR